MHFFGNRFAAFLGLSLSLAFNFFSGWWLSFYTSADQHTDTHTHTHTDRPSTGSVADSKNLYLFFYEKNTIQGGPPWWLANLASCVWGAVTFDFAASWTWNGKMMNAPTIENRCRCHSADAGCDSNWDSDWGRGSDCKPHSSFGFRPGFWARWRERVR